MLTPLQVYHTSDDTAIIETTHETVSTTTSTPQSINTINTTIGDTLVASNTVPTRATTLQLVVSSASLTTASLKSVQSLISVAYSSVSQTQSPPLIPAKYEPLSASTAGSLLLRQQGASTSLIQEHI